MGSESAKKEGMEDIVFVCVCVCVGGVGGGVG